MAASITEQLLEAVRVVLTSTIPAVGARVWRARQDEIARDECPAIVIHGVEEIDSIVQADGLATRVDLTVDIEIHVADGDPWETAADAIAVPAHALLMAATLPADATIDGRTGSAFAQGGDGTPAVRMLSYRASYYRQTHALDAAY